MPSFDAIVIGAGINGLAAAGRLAMAGARVTVLESAPAAGGMANLAHLSTGIDHRIEKALDLASHGLEWAEPNVASTALSASGNHLTLKGAFGESIEGTLSAADKAAWTALRRDLLGNAAALAPFKEMTPPRLARDHGANIWDLVRNGLALRRMGRDRLREFMRLMLINVHDVLEDELGDDRLKGLLAFDTVLGHHAGPRSPNSLLGLYHRISSRVQGRQAALALPRGGMTSVIAAMQKALSTRGVTLRFNAQVNTIRVDDDRVQSVTLANGDTLTADVVVSALHPATTLMTLVGAPQFDTGVVRRVQNIRSRGTTSRLTLKLKSMPDFRGANLRTRLVIAPSSRAVEEAFNAVKYGAFSPAPVMEIVIPGAFMPEADSDGPTLSALVQYAPVDLRMGWARGRGAFLKVIMEQLEAHAPGLGALVTSADLVTPADVAMRYGAPGGQWHHAELSVEQMLFLRPAIGMAQYSTPVRGLYLASAATHPGGGVAGSAGWNAAGQAIAGGGAA
ncbi:MAG: NAD(P)/FAD-dependent oxidoreductase [Rhizobiales bacterium]|nr:NAD(P)/FAD-dependent oxidoreductase [Hyphomicrobiales bacterium]